jgi:hypothetical protein
MAESEHSRDRDDFLPSPRHQAGEVANVHVFLQETDGAVGEDDVYAGRVKTEWFAVIRAVDGTRTWLSASNQVRRCTTTHFTMPGRHAAARLARPKLAKPQPHK